MKLESLEKSLEKFAEFADSMDSLSAAIGRFGSMVEWLHEAGEIEYDAPELDLSDYDVLLLKAMRIAV